MVVTTIRYRATLVAIAPDCLTEDQFMTDKASTK